MKIFGKRSFALVMSAVMLFSIGNMLGVGAENAAVLPEPVPQVEDTIIQLPDKNTTPPAEENTIPATPIAPVTPPVEEIPPAEENITPAPPTNVPPIAPSGDENMGAVGYATTTPVTNFAEECITKIVITDDKNNLIGNNQVAPDAQIKIAFDYAIPFGKNLVKDTEYSFDLPMQVRAVKSFTIVKEGDASITYANGTIENDITVKIKFTQQAEDDKVLESEEGGNFLIESQFVKAYIPNGTNKIIFFESTSYTKEIPVNFPIEQISAKVALVKTATSEVVDNRIKWEVTITPTVTVPGAVADANKINKLIITNTIKETDKQSLIKSGALNNAPTIKKGAADFPGGTFDESTAGQLTYTFPENLEVSAGDVYTLTYYTTYDLKTFLGILGDTADFSKHTFEDTVSGTFVYPQLEQVNTGTGSVQISSTKTANGIATSDGTATGSKIVLASVEVASKILSKTSTSNDVTLGKSKTLVNPKITWTITVNGDGINLGDASINIIDKIPAGLKISEVKLGNNALIESSTPAVDTNYTYALTTAGNEFSGGILTVPVLSNAEKVITYVAEIDPAIWETVPNKTFTNTVSFHTNYGGGPGYDFTRTDAPSINFAGGSGSAFFTGTGTYDTQTHMITWNFEVTGKANPVTNAVVTLPIPAGLKYMSCTSVGATIIDTDTSAVPADGAKNIQVTLPTPILANAKGEIELVTEVEDANIWATNAAPQKIILKNAELKSSPFNLKFDPQTSTKSNVIEKNSTSYDFSERLIEWQITLNQNKMPMTNLKIEDTLGEGLEFDYNGKTNAKDAISITDGTVSSATYEPTSRKLTINLGDITIGSTPPVIKYKTKVLDGNLLDPKTFTNSARVYSNEIPVNLKDANSTTVSANKEVGQNTLIKEGINKDSVADRWIEWTVKINGNKMTLPAGITLTDDFKSNPDLILDMDKIKLYDATVDATGKWTKGNEANANLYTYETSTYDKLVLKFNQEIKTPYILEFVTDNTNDEANPIGYTNKVTFGTSGTTNDGEVTVQTGALGVGTARTDRGSYSITAMTNETSPRLIPGIGFKITTADGKYSYTAVTGSDGVARFNRIRLRKYNVEIINSTQVPPGYALDKKSSEFELTADVRETTGKAIYETDVTLTYDGNGATAGIPPSDENHTVNGVVTVKNEGSLVKTDNIFDGWSMKRNGEGERYIAGDRFNILQDTTLYAQWKLAPVPIPTVPGKPVILDPQTDPDIKNEIKIDTLKDREDDVPPTKPHKSAPHVADKATTLVAQEEAIPDPTPAQTDTPNNPNNNKTNPNTADETPIMLYVILILIGATGAVCTLVASKKKKLAADKLDKR